MSSIPIEEPEAPETPEREPGTPTEPVIDPTATEVPPYPGPGA